MALRNPVTPEPVAPWGTYVMELRPMTIETFDILPLAEGWCFELYEGRLISMPGPANAHSDIESNFYDIVGNYIRAQKLGKLFGIGCYNLPLPNKTEYLLCPDMSFVQPVRYLNAKMRGAYRILAPDLVIEIASPSDSHPQMTNKAEVYMLSGVRLLWIAWPDEGIIEVWQQGEAMVVLSGTDILEGGTVIPGFSASVAPFFLQLGDELHD